MHDRLQQRRGDRDSTNNTECEDLESLTLTGEQHAALQKLVSVCKHAMGFWTHRYEHNQERSAYTTLCLVDKSDRMCLNASVDRDYRQFPVSRKIGNEFLQTCLLVLHPPGTMSNYFCILPGRKSCAMRKL